jgi:hypothetical protein
MPLLLVLIHPYDLVIIIVQFDVQAVTFEQRQYLSKGIIGVRSDGVVLEGFVEFQGY